jgi:hypothetical protein
MLPEEFLEQTRREKKSTLIIVACSGSKRSDDECAKLADPLGSIQEKTMQDLSPSVSSALKDFRACTSTYHTSAVRKTSKSYPAFLRYSGYFYKSVPIKADNNIWYELEKQNWNVLILSAYYGFLFVNESIQYYNLRISELKPDCKRKLFETLRSYLETNPDIAKVIFFASRQYTKPFVNRLDLDVCRLSLLGDDGNEVIGPYGKDFYLSAGKLFCSLISDESVSKMENVKQVILLKLKGY